MSEHQGFTIHLEQVEDFEFKVKFDWDETDDITLDEPEPMGKKRGPNASRVLASAVGHCLTASLLFCAKKARVDVNGMKTRVQAELGRNEKKRLRILGMDVQIQLPEGTKTEGGVERCLNLFEDYCLVTESVRKGIPVQVEVLDASGERIHLGGK
jgi:uncharacterized OsmC-like protein